MTREEKINTINNLNIEIQDILKILWIFDLYNPNNIYVGLRIPTSNFSYRLKIKDEILITVMEMLENKLDENIKKQDELLGVDND